MHNLLSSQGTRTLPLHKASSLCARIFLHFRVLTNLIGLHFFRCALRRSLDEFALPRVRTLWMSLIQAGIPLGVMLGYLLTGFLAEKGKSNPPDCHITVPPELESCCGQSPLGDVDCSRKSFGEISECCDIFSEQLVCPGLVEHEYNLAACCKNFDCPGGCWQCKWKFAVFVQICLLAPMCILCLLTPSRFFITNKITHQGNGADETEAGGLRRADSLSDYLSGVRDASQISIWLQIRILWRAKVFVWTSLGLSALYFVVAGIQFWVTQFIVEVLSISYSDALGAFTLVSATGPVGGVIFGGWLVDTLGGYKGTNGIARTTKVILILGVLAVCVAIPTTLIKNFSVMMALIWLLLFFGGAIVPAAVGICLSAVPPSLRPFSSSVSMCLYNILGHSAGCLLPGLLMDIIASARDCEIVKTTPSQILQPCALDILTIGFNLILLWSLNAWFTMSMSGIHAHKNMLASDEKKKENYKREENKKERAASTGDDCLPPRNNWRRLSKTEYDELFHTKVKVWDMESRELEGEMKRQALYQPMTGLFNHSDAAKGLVVKPTQFIVGKVVDSIKDARQRGESTNRGGGEGDRGSMNNL